MGRVGSALDNAVIESWHSTLEFELRRLEHFATRVQARQALIISTPPGSRSSASSRSSSRTGRRRPNARKARTPSGMRARALRRDGARSAGDADRVLGQVGQGGLRGADHVRPVLVGLLVADDHADLVGVLEVLDRLDGVAGGELVEVLDRQLVGRDVTELLAGGPGSLGGVLVALAAGDLLGATQRGAAAGGQGLLDRAGQVGSP